MRARGRSDTPLTVGARARVLGIIAAFDASVGVPVDESGRALPRPRVRHLHSDREGKLMSQMFLDFRADASLHHTTSPPHDHDLNPIAERVIGVISETASAIRATRNFGAPSGYWPWMIAYAVDWHNATIGSVGSSTADASITPHQRFTLRPPRVMDLPAFGCRAIVSKPPTHQHKTSFDPVLNLILMPSLAVFSDTAGGDITFGHDLSQSFAYRRNWQSLQQISTEQCTFYLRFTAVRNLT